MGYINNAAALDAFLERVESGHDITPEEVGKIIEAIASVAKGMIKDKIMKKIKEKIVSKIASLIAKKTGKTVAKSTVGKLPVVGAIWGVLEGGWTMASGDGVGKGLAQMGSGLATTVPGWGTAISYSIDGALCYSEISEM